MLELVGQYIHSDHGPAIVRRAAKVPLSSPAPGIAYVALTAEVLDDGMFVAYSWIIDQSYIRYLGNDEILLQKLRGLV